MLIEEINGNTKVNSYVIVKYENEMYPGIVISKIAKSGNVSIIV